MCLSLVRRNKDYGREIEKGIFQIKNLEQMKKDKAIRDAKNFDELLDIQYGRIGAKKRDKFEERAQYFIINETLKDARKGA